MTFLLPYFADRLTHRSGTDPPQFHDARGRGSFFWRWRQGPGYFAASWNWASLRAGRQNKYDWPRGELPRRSTVRPSTERRQLRHQLFASGSKSRRRILGWGTRGNRRQVRTANIGIGATLAWVHAPGGEAGRKYPGLFGGRLRRQQLFGVAQDKYWPLYGPSPPCLATLTRYGATSQVLAPLRTK